MDSTLNGTEDVVEKDVLSGMAAGYKPLHTPLVLILCTLGIFCNVIIILTLKRKELLNPTTLILISMSSSQLCLLVAFLFSTLYKLLAEDECVSVLWSYGWTLTLLINVNLSVVFHTIAVFHVVTLSVIRYITLTFFSRTQNNFLTLPRAKALCLLIILSVLFGCSTFFLNSEVSLLQDHTHSRAICSTRNKDMVELSQNNTNSASEIFIIRYSQIARRTGLLKFNFWLFGCIYKVVPCVIVLSMSVLLVLKLRSFQKNSERLRSRLSRNNPAYTRTTYMILSVMILFVAIELPQGILVFATGIENNGTFWARMYYSVGDLFEMLTVLYSSINFVIFCLMSSQFRSVFQGMLRETAWCRRICPGRLLGFTSPEDKNVPNHNDEQPMTEKATLLVNGNNTVTTYNLPHHPSETVGAEPTRGTVVGHNTLATVTALRQTKIEEDGIRIVEETSFSPEHQSDREESKIL